MYLDAERNSGTGNLEMDALIMVPYGHFISLDNINVPLAGGTVYVVTDADGQIQAIEDDGARITAVPQSPTSTTGRSPTMAATTTACLSWSFSDR